MIKIRQSELLKFEDWSEHLLYRQQKERVGLSLKLLISRYFFIQIFIRPMP